MANPELLEEQREETRLIIEELLEDGSDPDALYTIEHHLSADDFETLEKVAVEAFKLGYEVTEPEELEVEEGDTVICCDILSESALNAELIDAQVEVAEVYGGAICRRIARNFNGLPANTRPDFKLSALPNSSGVD